jgi:hypothetical protein
VVELVPNMESRSIAESGGPVADRRPDPLRGSGRAQPPPTRDGWYPEPLPPDEQQQLSWSSTTRSNGVTS